MLLKCEWHDISWNVKYKMEKHNDKKREDSLHDAESSYRAIMEWIEKTMKCDGKWNELTWKKLKTVY